MQFIGHTGRFNGVPATNRKVCWTENNIYRINDGRIALAAAVDQKASIVTGDPEFRKVEHLVNVVWIG